MSSATRSLRNRSSRSSPALIGDKVTTTRLEESPDASNGHQTRLDRWVEPPVRHAVPSFEDTKGLERLGVLEHMAPLGAAPTQKLLQKLKVSLNRSSPRMTPLQTDDADVSMIETSKTELLSPTNTEDLSESTRPQEPMVISTPPRGRPAKKDVEEMRQQAAELVSNGSPPVKTLFQQNQASPKPQSIQDYLRQDRMSGTVQRAIEEARKQSDPKLIPGLELLLEDARSKSSLWTVLDAVINKSPTNAQFRVFKRYIKRGIKDYQSSTPSSASPLKSGQHQSSSRRHHLGSQTQRQQQSPLYDTPSMNSSPKVKSSHERLQNALYVSQQASPSPTRVHDPKSPAMSDLTNPGSSNSRERSRSASIASSLSSAKSLSEQYLEGHKDAETHTRANGARAAPSAAQRQAANRVAAGSRTRSAGSHQPDSSPPPSEIPTTIKFVNKKVSTKSKENSTTDQEEHEARKKAFFDSIFNKKGPSTKPLENPSIDQEGHVDTRDSKTKPKERPPIDREEHEARKKAFFDSIFNKKSPSTKPTENPLIDQEGHEVQKGDISSGTFDTRDSKTKPEEKPPVDREEHEARKKAFFNDLFKNYNTRRYPESSERTAVNGLQLLKDDSERQTPVPVVHPNSLRPNTASLLSTPTNQVEPDVMIVNGTSRKRTYEEMDKDDGDTLTSLSSSPAPSLPPPPPPATVTRSSTPRASRLQPPNKARKSARVMISPNKPKNGGITAGFSRATTNKDGGTTNGAESGSEDNDEFCASCGGEGTLLCCDGCTNSFHHACLEPPLDPDQDVDGEWFCPRCIARRNKQPLPTTGLMARIIRRVNDTIPKAYSLPFEIRDYFEGVKTGDEGEYEETSLPRTQNNVQKMNRAGFIEQPNYKETRDSKGNLITCYNCGETANGRDIVPCDYCPAKWHTDCVDPPMAVPPRRAGGDKPNSYWRCPLHIDQDLASISRQAELMPGTMGRVPRLRRPKKAIPIDVAMTRGFRNNGIIDVDLMEEEMPDIKEISLAGGIYRLPEEGIRLDFIDRVKKNWYEDHAIPRQIGVSATVRERLYRPGQPVLHHPSALTTVGARELEAAQNARATAISATANANATLRQKSIVEQSAILSLLGLSESNPMNNNADPITQLVNELIANAPATAEQQTKTSERDALLRLQALVQERLTLLGSNEPVTTGIPDPPNLPQEVSETKIDPILRGPKLPLTSEMMQSDTAVNGDGADSMDIS